MISPMMPRMVTHSSSKTALVTGAARRIGREIALYLAQEGWDVALHCHRSVAEAEALAAEIRKKGRKAAVFQADLAQAAEASALVANATAALGPLSLLVHNAAVFEKEGLKGFTHEVFHRHMAVNLEAPLHLTRDFAAQAPEGSTIICLLDGMQGWSISAAYLAYALSKRGLEEAVRLLARSLAPRIRINGIALGATLQGVYDTPESFRRLAARAPMQRTGNIAEILSSVALLLAADGMTGQVIDLSGGMGLPPQLAADE